VLSWVAERLRAAAGECQPWCCTPLTMLLGQGMCCRLARCPSDEERDCTRPQREIYQALNGRWCCTST
jgi:hypothetical protein